jgi:hypothetical protein
VKVRLTQIDGKLPNLALMKLSHFHKSKGDEVTFTRSVRRDMFEPEYEKVYGSAVFATSIGKVLLLKQNFPGAVVGGSWNEDADPDLTIESVIGLPDYEHYDYEIYPWFVHSMGFSQRGCRLKCPFCGVPKKEGANQPLNEIEAIWRGGDHPRNILLLDNDFFGQAGWQRKAQMIIDGGFKVSFSQGINIRLIDAEGVGYLARMKYYDDGFTRRRIYTAWDNARDEKRFFAGINLLLGAGIRPDHIMVYFLCNYWTKGLSDDVWHRFNRMVDIGLKPYPMVFDRANADRDLLMFQRFVIRGVFHSKDTDFETFKHETKRQFFRRVNAEPQENLFT